MLFARKFPIGAELLSSGGVHFRVWAPRAENVSVEFLTSGGAMESHVVLQPEEGGYFSGLAPNARAGLRYKLKLDERGAFPDPASRFQPEGPHGPSEVVDPSFAWTDAAWRGRPPNELVGYELHLGTFTREGTWRAAREQLPELARIGVTLLEVMPIADFPGRFGWGYDGVDLFAPTRLYGTPAEARAFINRAHELGLMVILDVVYNHFGPAGNYLREFSPDYFSKRYANEWGDPINFDGEGSGPVRELFRTNARYWIEEFHFDGLRLDATQQIFDASPTHILEEITAAARLGARAARADSVGPALAAGPSRGARESRDGPPASGGAAERVIFVVAEDETQRARLVRPCEQGGYGLDAIWNDDFHHAAHVASTRRAEAYYSGYRGNAQELVSAVRHGFLYQGQWYRWQRQRRGSPALDLTARQFVHFLQNHDQVANSLHGLRLHQLASPAMARALAALLLLSPQIPLLFQGEEFAASAPFLYFADHEGELRRQVREGRQKFLSQFPRAASDGDALCPDPGELATFHQCRLDLAERERNAGVYALHIDLLRLRREDPTIAAPARVDAAVLGERAFVLRFFAAGAGGSPAQSPPAGGPRALPSDRLLIINLDADLSLEPAPEPLLAPIEGHGWRILWSSETSTYGGGGTPPLETKANWRIPGEAAVLLAPDENRELADAKLSQND